MIKKIILTFFLVLVQNVVFGQTVGDYRSNVATGNWITPGSWQICTSIYPSVTWASAINYPGQIAGTYAVLIQTGNTISIGASGISTQSMGTITINGLLVLTGDQTNGGINYFFNSQSMLVTAGLIPSANIEFKNKVNLKLPENASLQVSSSGLIGDCSAQQSIYIGALEYAVCKGNTADTGLTFGEVMGLGGTGSATSNSPVCVGNSINLSAIPPPNGTFTYSWSRPPSATVISTSQNPSIIATDATFGGIYSVTMTRADGKYSVSQTTVVVNSSLTPPTSLTLTAKCYGFSANWNASSGATSYELDVSTVNDFSSFVPGYNNLSVGNVTSYNITGLTLGTNYYFRVRAKNSCVSSSYTSSGPFTVSGPSVTKTWNGSWSPSAPAAISNDILIFDSSTLGTYNLNSDLTACSCELRGNVTVNINSTLTLIDKLTVATSEKMTFFNNASLVQINNVVNQGIIFYQRTARSLNTDYTYWSSPVSNQTLYDLIPTALAGTSYSYEQTDTSENWVNVLGSTTMTAGKGYIIRGREGTQTIPKMNDVEFEGVPNNGPYPISPIYSNKSYLLGNPYPSAINADMFLSANSSVLNGTLYFWTHNTPIQDATNITDGSAGSGAFAYTSNDYATYNITGGVGIDSGTVTGSAPSGGVKPNGFIAAGQGFFASTKLTLSATSIVFNNSMRIAGNNSQFFKKRNSKTEKVIEKNRIWLNLTNTEGAFKQTLVGYITDATNGYDDRFDGVSFDGNEFVDFYSVNQDKNLVIQGRALPFDENDEVPLGYRTTIKGAFTINIDQVDGSLTNQAVFLEDKLTNTVTDLKSGNYTFNTIPGTFNDRFVLRYKDNSTAKTLATDNFDSQANKVLVLSKNKQIKINSFAETIDKVTIYDLLGRQIYQKDKVNSNELSIANLVSSRQTLVVKTVLQNGTTVTDKIIY